MYMCFMTLREFPKIDVHPLGPMTAPDAVAPSGSSGPTPRRILLVSFLLGGTSGSLEKQQIGEGMEWEDAHYTN